MNRWIIFLIGALIIAMLAFAAGIQRGRAMANQACIDKVSQNCEYICGVPRDNFYYPDMERQVEETEETGDMGETAIARR